MTYSDSFGDSNLVVSTGGYGGVPADWSLGVCVAIIVIIALFVIWVVGRCITGELAPWNWFTSGFQNSPGSLRFSGRNSQVGLGESFSNGDLRGMNKHLMDSEGFMNSREQPFFTGVTNKVVRMENHEKEAIRALGKINQERMRRNIDDTSSTSPIAWEPFWKEWQRTRMSNEDRISGFEDTTKFDASSLNAY